jgi:hypothetical protein
MLTVKKPVVSPLVDSALAEIRKRGVEPLPDDIIWLHYAAQRMTGRDSRDLPILLDLPLEVGGTLLWPLCRGASLWYRFVALPLFGDDIRVLAFALAFGRDGQGLQRLATRAQIADKVNTWVDGLSCTATALEEAVDRVVMGDSQLVDFESPLENKKTQVRAVNYGEPIALLCHNYPGTTPEYWLWEVSQDFMNDAYGQIAKLMPGYSGQAEAQSEAAGEFRAIVLEIIRRGSENGRT